MSAGWVSVKDRMPMAADGRVLVFYEWGLMGTLAGRLVGEAARLNDVTHWMPLPPAPLDADSLEAGKCGDPDCEVCGLQYQRARVDKDGEATTTDGDT